MTGGSPRELQQRAANAYVVWPLAALDVFREPEDATSWTRLHARQAFVFGIAAALAYLMLMALPLAIVLLVPGIGTTAVVWLYVLGLTADLAGAIAWFAISLRLRDRAGRGELFAIPYVTPLADRLFPLERHPEHRR